MAIEGFKAYAPVFSDKTKAIISLIRKTDYDMDANEIAAKLNLKSASVNGVITRQTEYMQREQLEDGRKVIVLTEAGKTADLNAQREVS